VDEDAVLIAEVFAKKSRRTLEEVVDRCRARLRRYDDETGDL
jgi:hypothetical protein